MNVPVDFISGIPSYHMLNSFITAGMIRQPRVDLQDVIVNNDNRSSMGNESFNLTPTDDLRLPLGLCFHACCLKEGMMRNCELES
jgi:hypothetical protein